MGNFLPDRILDRMPREDRMAAEISPLEAATLLSRLNAKDAREVRELAEDALARVRALQASGALERLDPKTRSEMLRLARKLI